MTIFSKSVIRRLRARLSPGLLARDIVSEQLFDPAAAPRAEEYPLSAAPWRLWNQEHRSLHYTLEAYPEQDALILQGWCFELGEGEIPKLRLLINGEEKTLHRNLPRCDASLLFPKYPQAPRSGFRAGPTPMASPAHIDFQVLVRDLDWETLCSIDYQSNLSTQWEHVLDLVEHSGLIDASWYLARGREPGRTRRAAASHYLRVGAIEGLNPNPLFYSPDYWRSCPEALRQGANPLLHYLARGAAQGVRPNPLFDSASYLHRYRRVAAAGINPLAHYIHFGVREKRNPSTEFDTTFYLKRYPDVRGQPLHPLAHYLQIGKSEGRLALPPVSDCWCYRGPRFDPPAKRMRGRILVVGHLLGSSLFGGENSLLDIIKAIDADRFDVFAVFPQRHDRVFALIQPHVQGIAVLDYFWWRQNQLFQETTVRRFEELCRTQAIDLVHANTMTLSDPLIAARRLGIPGISHVREIISFDQELASQFGASPDRIGEIVCQNATYILANSAATLADYPCRAKGGYAYNSIDAAALDLPNIVDPNCIKVGLISSNILKKGILDFVELARLAEGNFPALQFHLIGPKPDSLREWQLESQRLPGNFHVHDYIWPPSAAYQDLNIVLNLSRCAESFGRTVAEAMAARRPVVAYRYGALPELIDDGETGFLVPYLDLSAVLDHLLFFAENPARITQFGETARICAIERFSPEDLRATITTLYEQLIVEGDPFKHADP